MLRVSQTNDWLMRLNMLPTPSRSSTDGRDDNHTPTGNDLLQRNAQLAGARR